MTTAIGITVKAQLKAFAIQLNNNIGFNKNNNNHSTTKVLSKARKALAAAAENNVGIFYCGCTVRLVERLCQL